MEQRLKEKETEVKLAHLKIKELKKQIPPARVTIASNRYGQSTQQRQSL
jgi:hypothetical protein